MWNANQRTFFNYHSRKNWAESKRKYTHTKNYEKNIIYMLANIKYISAGKS